MFWYNCIDTFVNGKRTKTNKRLLMRLKRWKITQTGTLTGGILQNLDALRAIFVWPRKMVSVSVCYLFYQTMDEKTQNIASSFSPQIKS